MSKLTDGERSEIPTKDFALPGKRKFPIEDRSHAQNALARASQSGVSSIKAEVTAAVHRKYPDMGKD